MRAHHLAFLLLALVLIKATKANNSRRKAKLDEEWKNDKKLSAEDRKGKVFSLFNIVQFANDVCSSISTRSGISNRNGTCYAQNECTAKGGTHMGTCAVGFGICCVFITNTANGNINNNCTYIQNPNFPAAFTGTTGLSYTISKCASNVCSLRLDFDSFTILGTGNTEELNTDTMEAGGECLDSFTIQSTATNRPFPVICGQNTGQHVYVDLGALGSDTATLTFAFNGMDTSATRMWEIKATQIECGKGPPECCLQYHTGVTGRLKTFNFDAAADNHLRNQDYSICIRQECGFCCVQYQVCQDDNAFSLSTIAVTAGVDTVCTLDYVGISGSSRTCNQGVEPNSNVKYCGTFLSDFVGEAAISVPICDCTAPFIVDIFTDNIDDAGDPAAVAANVEPSRGVCLEYRQIPCAN